eukprot:6481817-Amphidinium_carterae.2
MPAAPPPPSAAEPAAEVADHHATQETQCTGAGANIASEAAESSNTHTHTHTHNKAESELPELGADYAYLGRDGKQATLLVLKDKRTECLGATKVTAYALSFTVGWLRGGDHQANGLAEAGVREVKAQARILKSHLEERLGRPLDWHIESRWGGRGADDARHLRRTARAHWSSPFLSA